MGAEGIEPPSSANSKNSGGRHSSHYTTHPIHLKKTRVISFCPSECL